MKYKIKFFNTLASLSLLILPIIAILYIWFPGKIMFNILRTDITIIISSIIFYGIYKYGEDEN